MRQDHCRDDSPAKSAGSPIFASACKANEIAVEPLNAGRLREMEPHIAGLAGLWVPSTGIVDYRQVFTRHGRRNT